MTPVPPSSPFPAPSGQGVAPPAPSGFIGRYQVLDKIGEGGMGSLYLARDPAIDRLVAIKLLRRGFDTAALRERFAREARAAGRLRHPNIVTIFDVGEHDGDPFIAMEFLAGETLAELIRHGAGLSLARRLKLLEELCDGLSYAHRAGLVHRDIKPANLMVDADGVLKILDFGIVRGGGLGDSGMTQAGVLVGTINYMSPEQVLGKGVDHRSDIFAVGLVAYELLSGKQAFVGTLKDGLLRRIPTAEFEPLSKVMPTLDVEVVAIVEQALQKEPANRYQELARMRNDLARARQRIEVEEERAAVEAASASAETALIAEEPTAPGVVLEAPKQSGHRLIADAERALAEGNYRFALTIAGRAAAVDPRDRTPSSIVARAEAGLLERGRTVESSRPVTPVSAASNASGSAPAVQPASSATSAQSMQRVTYLAVAVATVALLVAAFAVWSQVWRTEPTASAPSQAVQDRVPPLEQPAATPAQPPSSPAAPAPATQSKPQEPDTAHRPAGTTTDPRQTAVPDGSLAAQKKTTTVVREPASKERRGNQGRRTERDGRVTPPAPQSQAGSPQAAASAGEAPPTGQPREPVQKPEPPPEIRLPAATAPPTLPGAQAPKPSTPVRPQENAESTKTAPVPPQRDPRAEAQAAIEQVLRRYEAAWEGLNFDALMRVQALSGSDARVVRDTMNSMREYAMDVSVQSISIQPDARSATVVCRITYRYQGPVSGRQTQTRTSTFSLEKRGENWMIASIR